jgi:hypothetical protein
MRKGRDGQKPVLANGKLPFTPIVHKQADGIATPYQPLHVEDLETPKEKVAKPDPQICSADPASERREPEGYQSNDVQELRQGLVMCVDIVARLERASESKVYRSVGTQTQSNGGRAEHEAAKLVRPLEVTEVVFSDDSQSSPVNKPQQAKMWAQDPDAHQKARKAFSPRAGNLSTQTKHEDPGSGDSVRGHAKAVDNPNLQKRIHEMSLLLKRLELQLDGMNAPV